MYEKYLKEKWVRLIKKSSFQIYVRKFWWYDKAIEYLRLDLKEVRKTKKWYAKWGNIQEIIDFANLTSIDRAAKQYWVSTRTIYRYMKK